jgi:protein-S-isoprenylcysteine O-methyltransferase Ste14
MFGRRPGDFVLFCVTSAELALLLIQTPTFTITDSVYVLQHALVLGIALTRPRPKALDDSPVSIAAVVVAYSYSYAQVIYLAWKPGTAAWPPGGLVIVTFAAGLSLASIAALGRLFGVLPALRGLQTKGPYRIVRHPMYLAYILGDIGYNLQEWNFGTGLLVIAGWLSLLYRIYAEERILSHDAGWPAYAASVPYRLVPGVW